MCPGLEISVSDALEVNGFSFVMLTQAALSNLFTFTTAQMTVCIVKGVVCSELFTENY